MMKSTPSTVMVPHLRIVRILRSLRTVRIVSQQALEAAKSGMGASLGSQLRVRLAGSTLVNEHPVPLRTFRVPVWAIS